MLRRVRPVHLPARHVQRDAARDVQPARHEVLDRETSDAPNVARGCSKFVAPHTGVRENIAARPEPSVVALRLFFFTKLVTQKFGLVLISEGTGVLIFGPSVGSLASGRGQWWRFPKLLAEPVPIFLLSRSAQIALNWRVS